MKKTFLKGLKTTFYSLGLLLLLFTVMFFTSQTVKAAASRQIDVTVGWDEGSVTTSTNPQNVAPSVTLTATPYDIATSKSTLTWTTRNADSCQAVNSVETPDTSWTAKNTANDSETVSLSTTTPYWIRCTGSGGSNTGTVTVNVTTPAPSGTYDVTVTTDSNGKIIHDTDTVTSSATFTVNSGATFGPVIFTGNSGYQVKTATIKIGAGAQTSILPAIGLNTYTYPAISITDTTFIDVTWATTSCPLLTPAVTLAAFPQTINYGASSTLYWNSTGADSCTGTNFTPGATSGNKSVSPSTTTTYSLVCSTGTGASKVESLPVTAIVTVTGSPATAPVVTTGTSTVSGLSAALTGTVTNHGTVVGGGAATISQKGFYYWLTSGTNHTVTTIIDSSTVDSIGATKSLSAGDYGWQAYVKNSAGLTAIGSIKNFTITPLVATCPANPLVTDCAGLTLHYLDGTKACVGANVTSWQSSTVQTDVPSSFSAVSTVEVEPGFVGYIGWLAQYIQSVPDQFFYSVNTALPWQASVYVGGLQLNSVQVMQTNECDVAGAYEKAGYMGFYKLLHVGNYTQADLKAGNTVSGTGLSNDVISSIKVNPGYEVILYNTNNWVANGGTKVITSDTANLAGTFNDVVSSLSVIRLPGNGFPTQ